MKKIIITLSAAVIMLTSAFSINAEQASVNSAETNVTYTMQDIRNLQDFILGRPTEKELVGKPYDLNGDERWDVFDLCLMRRSYIETHKNMNPINFDIDRGTVMLNSGYEMPIWGSERTSYPPHRQMIQSIGHCVTVID